MATANNSKGAGKLAEFLKYAAEAEAEEARADKAPSPRDRRPATLPPVFRTAPNGCRHRAANPAGARENAIKVLLASVANAELMAARAERGKATGPTGD